MNTVGLIPKRYVVAVPLMLAGVLLMCYSAMASARRGGTQNGVTMAGVAPAEHDRDSEYLEKRREFLSQFFGTGPGGVSPSAYTAGLAAAGVLPPSPLLQNGRFRSPEALAVPRLWTFAASKADVFASTDGGVIWGNMSDGIPTGMIVTALSFNALNRRVAAATFGRGVYMLYQVEPRVRPRPTPHPWP